MIVSRNALERVVTHASSTATRRSFSGLTHPSSSTALPKPRLDYRDISENVVFKSHNAFNRRSPLPVGAVQSIRRLYEEQKQLSSSLNAQRHARSLSKIAELEGQLENVEERLHAFALAIPNDTHPSSPIGPESAAVTLSMHGPAPLPASPSRDHVSICRALGLFEFEAGALVTGSSWYYLKNEGALLELAIINYALSIAIKHGFAPVITPDVVRSDIARRCGFQPRDQHTESPVSQMYHLANTETSSAPELVLAGTAEIPLAGFFANKILSMQELPTKVVGLGHAFRAEAGARGTDTRGLYRVHQFTKLELFAVTEDSHSEGMMDEMRQLQVEIFEGLGLSFRVLDMPTEELGASAYRKYDMEAWMPGRGSWGEISSTSNCTDYQARRLHIRYRRPSGAAVGIDLPKSLQPFWVGGNVRGLITWSSITEWVEILTSSNYDDEAYDGIPEIVDSINIQATGTAEVSRAIRKKLKHGNAHQQYRALVVHLEGLVENCGHKFQTSFADDHLTDAIKVLATDSSTDPKVKKKLVSVLTAWHSQFKDDPGMSLVANLYKQCKIGESRRVSTHQPTLFDAYNAETEERRKREEEERRRKEEEKLKTKEEKERLKAAKEKSRKDEEAKKKRAAKGKVPRKVFNFEQEKPQVLTAIASASQASSNLVNAITLVNTEHDSLQSNERVQECLANAKQVRRQIVRYIQLVENEDMIGTLIETNDRIIAAIESYDTLSKPQVTEQDVQHVQEGLAAAKSMTRSSRAAVQRSIGRAGSTSMTAQLRGKERDTGDYGKSVHPDLQDLSFGPLGSDQRNLPPPLRPSAPRSSEDNDEYRRGSLSDFSDYQSSDEETHTRGGASSSRARAYVDVSENEDDRKCARELAIAALANGITVLIAVIRDFGLGGDGQDVVVHVDVHVLFLEAGELERGSDSICLRVFVQVKSIAGNVSETQ
ncbi:seryl-tRNA synthetase [Amylocystis lapponica]|nr:seryl-tRNA synthetase [Amylocystis lapponica]